MGEQRKEEYKLNQQTLDKLKERGSDLNKVHKIDFTFWVLTKEDAQKLEIMLENFGFIEFDISEAVDDNTDFSWSLSAGIKIIPVLERINELTDICIDMAKIVGADHDGWYTEVLK